MLAKAHIAPDGTVRAYPHTRTGPRHGSTTWRILQELERTDFGWLWRHTLEAILDCDHATLCRSLERLKDDGFVTLTETRLPHHLPDGTYVATSTRVTVAPDLDERWDTWRHGYIEVPA